MDNQQQHQNMRNTNQENDHQNSSSNSSSPSHEFSFTISFQQTKQITPPPPSSSTITSTTNSSSSFAIDLSPADDIFFHGHLLPLHLLSHLPIASSPRSSTNSLDGFTLPKKDHFFHQEHKVQNSKMTSCDSKGKVPKTKPFSLFGIQKWRKGYEVKDQKDQRSSQHEYSKKMSQVVKRYYIKIVRPFLSFRNKKNMQFHSFSGNLLKGNNKKDFRGILKEQYSSAPASIRTSPTNSGLLVATPTGGHYSNYNNSSCCSSSDSTMEELQAAIQAAIAHCKKSISMEDNIK